MGSLSPRVQRFLMGSRFSAVDADDPETGDAGVQINDPDAPGRILFLNRADLHLEGDHLKVSVMARINAFVTPD
jgi:hypothetical protein